MEGYPDGSVDIKRPSDDEENGFFANRSQGYCGLSQPSHAMTIPLRPVTAAPDGPTSPTRPRPAPPLNHASSSNSHISQSQIDRSSSNSEGTTQRPSLADDRRLSSGLGGGMGSLPSLKSAVEGNQDVVPVGFDEGILRGLCDMDVS